MNEQLTGPQMAVRLLAQIGDEQSDAAIAAVHDLAEEHAQRLTLQHHAADQAQRIADLETKCATLKELHDAAADERDEWRRISSAYSPQKELSTALEQAKESGRWARKERDELRAKYDELLVALHGIGAALGLPEGERSPYSITCGTLERVNRLAEIEAQEPVAWQCRFTAGGGWDRCTQEHYAYVRQNTADWPDYEVRELIAAAPEHKA